MSRRTCTLLMRKKTNLISKRRGVVATHALILMICKVITTQR